MRDWHIKKLADIFIIKNDKAKQIKSTEYLPTGSFPVIDQSEGFICGYCDDESRVITENLPLIIFGDHTRCVKFVDFAFVAGADGTQILKPISTIADRYFFYLAAYASERIGNYGYDRHIKHFKEFTCLVPNTKEDQIAIAKILSTIDEAIGQTEKLIAKQQRIKRGLLYDLLTKGIDEHGAIRSEATHEFKDSPLGRIPKEWESAPVGSVFEMILGKMLNKEAKNGDNQFFYLANRNVLWDSVDLSDLEMMSFSEYERRKLELKFGDLLICEGGAVGRTAMWRDERSDCYFQKAIHRLRANQDFIIPEFMLNFMKLADEKGLFIDLTSQTSIAHLTQEKLALLLIPLPSIEEQRRIVKLFEQTRSSLLSEEMRRKKFLKVKTGLMQDLLAGKVRINSEQTNLS